MSGSTPDFRTTLIEANDIRFETLTCGNPDSDKLALCLHGFPEHAHSWRHQMPVLAKLGYRVWAPNQRGYGNTTRPVGRDAYHLDQLLVDVGALIDVSGANAVTLVAHDWGAVVAWIFALRKIRPLERLVIMNLPHPTLFHHALMHNKQQRRRSLYERFFQLPWLPEVLFRAGGARAIGDAFRNMAVHKERFTDDALEVYRRNALAPGAMTAMLNWYRANPFRIGLAGEYEILDTPTLMIWGEHDNALGKEMTYGTDELVRDFTIRYLNASHWVQQDAPEETNAILSAWLTGQTVPDYG